jgi:bile acid:Na+ symporter, BASS family
MELPVLAMMRLLLVVIFVPVLTSQVLKKFSLNMVEFLKRYQFPISLCWFAVTNMGVFSKYSNFFYREPVTIVPATVAACLLAIFYFFIRPSALLGKADGRSGDCDHLFGNHK